MSYQTLEHRFVEYILEQLEAGVLYVSIPYATAAHLCCCGCGHEVNTPLTPTDWQMTYDGEHVSLNPSIGNWSLPCQSHYWITPRGVKWSAGFSREKVEAVRARDRVAKDRRYGECKAQFPQTNVDRPSWLVRLRLRLRR